MFSNVSFGWHIAGCAFAIASDADEGIGPRPLRGELKLDVSLAGEKEQLGEPEIKRRNLNAMAGVRALAPAQAHGGKALLERLGAWRQLRFQLRDREARAVARFEPQRSEERRV